MPHTVAIALTCAFGGLAVAAGIAYVAYRKRMGHDRKERYLAAANDAADGVDSGVILGSLDDGL